MSGVDVFQSRELQLTLAALKVLPSELTKQTRQHTKKLADVEWQRGLQKRAVTPLQRAVLARTAVTSVTATNVAMKSATKGKLSSGTAAHVLAGGAEFGSHPNAYSKYSRRSKNGGSHTVTRRTMRGFGHYRGTGRVVFPTAQDLAPRIASIYVQTLLRTTAEAFDN